MTTRRSLRYGTVLAGATGLALAAAVATATTASAATAAPAGHAGEHGRRDAVVFVQNDALAGNQVLAYHRGTNGSLSLLSSYATGGAGGRLTGALVDVAACCRDAVGSLAGASPDLSTTSSVTIRRTAR